MFKLTRYFFIVFLVTTIIPLTLMLVWNHNQIEKMRKEKDNHFLNVSLKQLSFTTNHYLDTRKSFILKIIQNLGSQKISLEQFKNIFEAEQVEWVYKTIDSPKASYEIVRINKKPKLAIVLQVPYLHGNIKGIKLVERVDINQLRPAGPFGLVLYQGNEVFPNKVIDVVYDPFFINEHNNHHFDFLKPSSAFKIRNKAGDVIAVAVLKFNLSPDNFIKPSNKPPLANDFKPMPIEDKMPPIGHFPLSADEDKGMPMLHPGGGSPPSPLIKPSGPAFHVGIMDNEFGVIILIAGSILSLLLGFFINKNFINPLLVLSQATKKVEKGDLSFELSTDTKQEQILSTFNNFNKMIRGLKEKEELRQNFIANLTHDLKTPLIAQERSLFFISKKFESLGLTEEYNLAKGIEKNNSHLLRMVNLILESYRFDAEDLKLLFSDINLFDLVNACYEKLEPLAWEKNIKLINKISEDFVEIKGDVTAIKRVFVNLISNSIESLNQDGIISISAEKNGNNIKIVVEDNGPGISPEDIPYIFERYYTGKSDERKIGSGLGLYVCKKLLKLHKGKIVVESIVNESTRFIITLPV